MELPFISNAPGGEGQYTVNMYLRPETATSRPALCSRPGLVSRVVPATAYDPVRGMIKFGSLLYAICDTQLYRITGAWGSGVVAGSSIPGTSSCQMLTDGTYISICNGERLYVYEPGTDTWTDVRAATSIAYQDSYILASNPNSATWSMSEINDPLTWNAADFGTAAGLGDNLVALRSLRRSVYLFGTESYELWFNVGTTTGDFPFERTQPGLVNIGLGARDSVKEIDEFIYFLDNEQRIVRAQSSQWQVISTDEITNQIGAYTDPSDAIGYYITFRGHPLYVLTFPTDDVTWTYDISTQSWFVWSSKYEQSFEHRFMGMCATYFDGEWLVGSYADGSISSFDPDASTDNGEEIRWQRTLPPIYADGVRFFFHELGLEMKVGLSAANLTPYRIWLDYSDDNGRTWSTEKFASIGAMGEFDARVIWRMLGSGRNRMFRVTGSDPFGEQIYGAYLRAKPGRF